MKVFLSFKSGGGCYKNENSSAENCPFQARSAVVLAPGDLEPTKPLPIHNFLGLFLSRVSLLHKNDRPRQPRWRKVHASKCAEQQSV